MFALVFVGVVLVLIFGTPTIGDICREQTDTTYEKCIEGKRNLND